MFEVIAAKLHGIKVTKCELNYHGSITIDEDLLDLANIPAGVFVYIWNKSSGSRISTYTLPGKRGSGEVCLNGAAARHCEVGDDVIISLPEYLDRSSLVQRDAIVLTFNHEEKWNSVDERLAYRWDTKGAFKIVPLDASPEPRERLIDSPSLCSLSS